MAADTVRLVVQTLLRHVSNGYPDAGFDVLVRHNRTVETRPEYPLYETHSLKVHPRCAWHRPDDS